MVDRSLPFRGRSWLFRGRLWLAFITRVEAGGMAVGIGGTAIRGGVGGVIADPIGAEQGLLRKPFLSCFSRVSQGWQS